MSTMRFSLLLVFLAFHLVSCMPVMKLGYGLHQPKYVSDDKVVKFYHNLGLHDEIYRVNEYSEANRKKFQYLGSSIPDVLVFNSSGQLTSFELDCSGSLDSIVSLSIQDIDDMSVSSAGKTIDDFMDDTYIVDALTEDNFTHFKNPVYVVKFAEFAGLLNKDNVLDLVQSLRRRGDVQYIVLNMDYTVKNRTEKN